MFEFILIPLRFVVCLVHYRLIRKCWPSKMVLINWSVHNKKWTIPKRKRNLVDARKLFKELDKMEGLN